MKTEDILRALKKKSPDMPVATPENLVSPMVEELSDEEALYDHQGLLDELSNLFTGRPDENLTPGS